MKRKEHRVENNKNVVGGWAVVIVGMAALLLFIAYLGIRGVG